VLQEETKSGEMGRRSRDEMFHLAEIMVDYHVWMRKITPGRSRRNNGKELCITGRGIRGISKEKKFP